MKQKFKANPWPCAIIAYFIIFVGAMAGWIGFAMRNDMELVRPDYYDHEIRYQTQIDREVRTRALSEPARLTYQPDDHTLTIVLPEAHRGPGVQGELHLYRPASARLDQRVPIDPGQAGSQTINLAGLAPGLWKARLSWSVNGQEYYFDQPLVLAGGK